jgi:hypothetical protein
MTLRVDLFLIAASTDIEVSAFPAAEMLRHVDGCRAVVANISHNLGFLGLGGHAKSKTNTNAQTRLYLEVPTTTTTREHLHERRVSKKFFDFQIVFKKGDAWG